MPRSAQTACLTRPPAAAPTPRPQVSTAAYNYATGEGNGKVNVTRFAQLVWKSTLRLGCAYKRCATVNGLPGWVDVDLIVCRYDPPGALPGQQQFRANVLPPGGTVSSSATKPPPAKAAPKRPPPPAKPLRPPPKVMPRSAPPRRPPPKVVARTNPPNRPPPRVVAKAPPAAPAGSASTGSFQPSLDLHNAYRRRHKAPALKWDAAVAATAAAWASRCIWGHDGANNKYGENLFILSGAPFNQSSGVEIWYNEVTTGNYNYATGKGSGMTGHFTQVWARRS